MLPAIPSYRPYGQPAVAYVDFLKQPGTGDTITINGVAYVFGTNVFGVGRSVFANCQAFAEAIRGEPNNDGHSVRNPISGVTAIAYGSTSGQATARLFLLATEPGTGGNALTLTTNNSATFAVSGATFSGGTATGSGSSTAANQVTQVAAEQAIQAAVEKVIPATTAAAVTPSDSTALTSRAVWVGGAGDLSVRLSGATGTTVVFTAVPAGSLLPISVVRVMAATTATNINVLN